MQYNKEYICQCEKAKLEWEPMPGDHYFRKYTVFGEEVDEQIWSKDKREKVEILCYKPNDAKEFWVGTGLGTEDCRSIITSDKDLCQKTCIWLPTQEQL